MARQRSGHIVNTAAIGGLAAAPMFGAYCATKHAIVGLSRALLIEAPSYGVNVSVACPGFVDTAIADSARLVGGLDRARVLAVIPFELMPPDACARALLRGVARNDPEIVIAPHARNLYWLNRLAPRLLSSLTARQFPVLRAKARRPS
jgi:short-subunit dehydrogenase